MPQLPEYAKNFERKLFNKREGGLQDLSQQFDQPRTVYGPNKWEESERTSLADAGRQLRQTGRDMRDLYDAGAREARPLMRDAGVAAQSGLDVGAAGLGRAQAMTEGVGRTTDYMADYYDPYTERVIDYTESQMRDEFERQGNERYAGASAVGALGGSRHGIADLLAGSEYGKQLGLMGAQLRSDMFNTALSAGQSDRDFMLDRAGQYGDQAVDLGDLYYSGADALGDAGEGIQGMYGTQAKGLGAAGALRASGLGQIGEAQGEYGRSARSAQQAAADAPFNDALSYWAALGGGNPGGVRSGDMNAAPDRNWADYALAAIGAAPAVSRGLDAIFEF